MAIDTMGTTPTLNKGDTAGNTNAPTLGPVVKGDAVNAAISGSADGIISANRTTDTNGGGVYIGAQGGSITVASEKDGMRKVASMLIENRHAGLADIQRNFAWIVTVDLSAYMGITSVPGVTTIDERFGLTCQQVTPPAMNIEQIAEEFMGGKQYHAGKRTFAPSMQIVFTEREDGLTLKAWELWMNEVFNNDHRLGLGGSYHAAKRSGKVDPGYSRNVYIWQLNYANTAITMAHVALNAWPMSITATPLSYTGGSSSMQVTVTLSLDNYLPVL